MVELTYSESFNYTHKNPYHDKLGEFDSFVLRDKDPEKFPGRWNSEVFQREAPIILEIGCGYGHFLIDYTCRNPEINYIGIDYRFKRSFQLARRLSKIPQKNFRILRARGERVQFIFSKSEIDSLFYFFPDPWPKNKHTKKRLFQETFLINAYHILKPKGSLYIKTDHPEYAKWMIKVAENSDLFQITLHSKDVWSELPNHILTTYPTKFEKIFLAKDVKIQGIILTSRKEA